MMIRSLAKKIIAYAIEDEYKVYRLRKTKLRIRIRFTRKYHKHFDHEPICPNKIVFDNYMGNGYGCNPKYVLKRLLEMPQELTEGSCLDHQNTGTAPPYITCASEDCFV